MGGYFGKIKSNMNGTGVKKLLRRIFHPAYKVYKRKKIKTNAQKARLHYEEVIDGIKMSGRTRIRFAAYVIFDSTYGMDGVYKIMIQDEARWDPYVVIIPDVSRGKDHAEKTYKKSKDFFANRYGADRILDGWNCETDEYFDYADKFDIIYYANPYDGMAHEYHKISYACTKKNVLPVYVSYGYDVGKYTTLNRLTGHELNYVWKLFADTTYTYDDYKRYQIIKGENVVLAGYSKMDSFCQGDQENKKRKKILISPHHTISTKVLPLSNFLEYSDLILRLPDIFPDVDFVFRPHPLLFTTLENTGNWTNNQVEEYLSELKRKGVEYSSGGDYLKVFSECDAIINDCGSFTVEWLYTGKPGCFVYNNRLRPKQLTTLMNKAIEEYDIARSEQDILGFIRKVISESDKEYKMKKWVKENIAINYPDVSSFILKQIDILN